MNAKDFFNGFYGGNPQLPGARQAPPVDFGKSFFQKEQPGVRELSKSGGIEVDAVGVLDYHMRKATQDNKKKKREDGFGGGLK
jgi:hypothetical protein